MFFKVRRQVFLIAGVLSISAPSFAQALTWDEWNHSSSPFCGFISIFCVSKPAPVHVAAVAEPAKPHKHHKPAAQAKTPD
jgi:hypothetical protein